MRSPGFRRFVAGFVGIVLILAIVFGIVTDDEQMLLTAAAIAGFYVIYLYLFIKKEKEQKMKDPKSRQSPLLRK